MIENEKVKQADMTIKDSVIRTSPDRLDDWNNHHKDGSAHSKEEIRYCGRKNYDFYSLMTTLWTSSECSSKDPLLPEDQRPLPRLLRDLPSSFVDEVLSIKKQELNYDELIQASSKRITKNNPKFNVIVPVKNRKDHMFAFLNHMNFVLSNKNDWCVTVILQEETDELFRDVCSRQYHFNVNCIYLPHKLIREKYADNMNRSLCYNLVSKIVECDWQINHDVDCIFFNDYIQNVERKTQTDIPWLQPFRGSRVIYLNEDVTANIMRALELQQGLKIDLNGQPPLNNTPHFGGAPGGSIAIRHKTFMEIGGYDPEFVWGYAPEDAIFWRKLEYYFSDDLSIFGKTQASHPFLRHGVFSHETNVELLHLWHPPTQADHRYPFWSLFISNYIINALTENDIKKWLQISKEKLA